MTTFTRLQVYNTLIRSGLVPIFYMDDPQQAQDFAEACVRGGVRAFELTNRGSAALTVFQHLRAAFPDVALGIGSIVDAPTAALFIAHGANFIVSPSFDADVAHLCNQRKIAYLPGCVTPTEIQSAHAAGVEIIKLFPADVYGAAFVKAVKAPMPWTRFMPTGGIEPTESDIKTWFSAGVSCIGMGSSLTQAHDVTATCQQVMAWIARYRKDDAHGL